MMRDPEQTIGNLIDRRNTSFVGSVDEDGYPEVKAMLEVLEDAWAKELIWLDGDETYYPLGVTDPDYCVLRFTAERGRYYQNFSSEDFAVPAV